MKITITKNESGLYKVQYDDPQWIVRRLKESDTEIIVISVDDKGVIVSVKDVEVIRNCFDCGRHEVVYISVSDTSILKVWGTIFDLTCFNLPLGKVEELEKIKELTVIVSSFDRVSVSGNSSKFPLTKLIEMIN